MLVYGPNDAKPDWMEDRRREIDARNDGIASAAVAVARASLRDGQDLRHRVAEYICNSRHSGIDVWSMVKDQPDTAAIWLGYADALIQQDCRRHG